MARYDRKHTKLLIICGPMQNYQCPTIAAAAANLSASGLTVAFANASLPNSPNGLSGCAGHPNTTEAAGVMELVTPVVKKLMGWDY